MIHILRFILKMLVYCILSLTIGLGCIILSILLWDGYYMDKSVECYDHLWEL